MLLMLKEYGKRNISLRLGTGDHQKIKRVAMRLGVRESDVLRFAIKSMLNRVAPLHEPSSRGRELLPAFLNMSREIINFFDLDGERLDRIVNTGTDDETAVSRADLELLAMSAIPDAYFDERLREAVRLGLPDADQRTMPSVEAYLFAKYLRTEPTSGNERLPAAHLG
jgi:hypothetical protein